MAETAEKKGHGWAVAISDISFPSLTEKVDAAIEEADKNGRELVDTIQDFYNGRIMLLFRPKGRG